MTVTNWDALARRRNSARQAVLDWMAQEGREGRLRRNEQAPAWAEYEAAERELAEAITAVGQE